MRRLLLVMLTLAAGAGCVSDQGKVVSTSAWAERLKPKMPDATPGVIELHYIFLERPLGDPVVQTKIWEDADELILSLDKKNEWESNGLRLGKLGSRLSPDVLKLLENSNPTGAGRRHVTNSGGLVKVQMTENLPVFKLLSVSKGSPRGEEIADAQGMLQMIASADSASAVHLEISPIIEHGPKENKWTPAPDLSGMQLRTKRETKMFPDLTVDLDLASGEYILIGRVPDKTSTLGDQYFTKEREGKKYETALLVRVVRPSRDALYSAGNDYDEFFLTPIRRDRPIGTSNIREAVFAARSQPSAIEASEAAKGL